MSGLLQTFVFAFGIASASAFDYAAVKSDVVDLVRAKNCGPILVRLSWHDAGKFMSRDCGVCAYLCVYVRFRTCMCVYTCVHMYTYTYTYTHVYAHTYIHVHVYTHMYTHVYTHCMCNVLDSAIN